MKTREYTNARKERAKKSQTDRKKKTQTINLGRYSKVRKPKVFTKEMDLADEIYGYFGKKLKFAPIMRLIKIKGYQFMYECWSEARHSNFPHKLELFMSLVGKTKIKWLDEKKNNL